MKISTEHFSALMDATTATTIFEYLRDNVDWEDGIRSRSGPTRLAKSLSLNSDELVKSGVMNVLTSLSRQSKNSKALSTMVLLGLYLNFYRNGDDWTPTHSHKGSMQIIISLGGTRTLQIGKKDYPMANGDVAFFGGANHGVPKQSDVEPRISIALFCKAVEL